MRATILLAALILLTIAHLRPPEYDESYSIFLTAGDPRPAWPTTPFFAAQVRPNYTGQATFTQIAQNLRAGDVHPPLYFWVLNLWRHLFGESWQTARLLSVLCSLATLTTLAHVARQTKTPVIPTLLITVLAYGYAYTSTITRNFALAQLLTTLGLAVALDAVGWVSPTQRGVTHHLPAQTQPPWKLTAAGALFSAATFTNYLTIFTPIATLLWLLLTRHCEERSDEAIHLTRHNQQPHGNEHPLQLPSTTFFLAGLATFLPADLIFFTAQHASRTTQFPPFHPIHAAVLIAKDSGAALFGGLPLYAAPHTTEVAAALLIFFLICLFFTKPTLLFTLTALATPIGLFLLGLTFHNTPIEIRYLAFSIPPLALILATLPKPLLATLILLESLGTIGLAFAPSTMQPQALAAYEAAALATPATLVLVPYGNDGVGIPGPFIEAAPDTLNIKLIHPGEPPNPQAPRIIVAQIRADDSSREAVAQTLNFLQNNPCWRPGASTPLTAVFESRCPHQQN